LPKRLQIDDMKFILSPHNVTLTKGIEDHVRNKIDKLEHMDQHATSARITLEHDKTKAPDKQFSCSILISIPGQEIFAEDCEADLYAAIDLATKKLEQQLRKRHNKDKAVIHGEGVKGKESARASQADGE
jgi:putative sigma-54 modulation protein